MMSRRTDSNIELKPAYTNSDVGGEDSSLPGEFPFTRGIHPNMYRDRLWTMRQYSGFGTAAETNRRFRYLLEKGQSGLSCAFDLPTQMGYDSDHPRAVGEVGRVGVAIDSLDDMRTLLDGIPLDEVSTSMTINSTACILLLLYELVAEERGFSGTRLRGTIQNDILKEYIARGTYIFPPGPSMRLVTDTFAYCRDRLPAWNTISISGYHIREAGSTAVQEVAFTIANGLAYAKAAVDAGLPPSDFVPRLSFFWNAHNNFFEEVSKFRAARRVWAYLMKELYGLPDEQCSMRFHVQTAGSTLTAQQPDNNVTRVALQALSAVLGGTQSLHTNAADEAIGLPSEHSATVALRSQQVLAYESGVADVADPLGGSYFVEALTAEIEGRVTEYLDQIDAQGGAVPAIEAGYQQREIERAAVEFSRAVETGDKVIVGVNKFTDEAGIPVEVPVSDPAAVSRQLERVAALRRDRDGEAVDAALSDVRAAARGTQNLLPVVRIALSRMATLGEVSGALREEFGTYEPGV